MSNYRFIFTIMLLPLILQSSMSIAAFSDNPKKVKLNLKPYVRALSIDEKTRINQALSTRIQNAAPTSKTAAPVQPIHLKPPTWT